MQLSADEVLRLAPDDASAKAARGLVVPGKWPQLQFDDAAIWGECQGSGSKPYQVQVDKNGPAFRCSCPSRKFPCKHGLALLLLLAQHADKFSAATQPAWVTDWLASRRDRAERQEARQEARAAEAAAPADPQAAAKREATRAARMRAGLDDLNTWLADRLRQGLAQLPAEPQRWHELAARMVDAQLPGMAYRLKRLGAEVGHGEHWPARVLGGMGELALLGAAFDKLDTLAAGTQADVRAALGLTVDRERVEAHADIVADEWLVIGQRVEEEERLWVRRVWLHGAASGRDALLLDFAHGTRRFDRLFTCGSAQNLRLAFYPGNAPLRALVLDDAAARAAARVPTPLPLDAALDAMATRRAANPWQSPLPMLVGGVVPCQHNGAWTLHAGERVLPMKLSDDAAWELMALSGGVPLAVFGEWLGEALVPLSAWQAGLVWVAESEGA